MKMVAAAKLRRAQEQAEAARPYAERMDRMLAALAASCAGPRRRAARCWPAPARDQVHLLVVVTADRGLCGAFNSSIVREARQLIRALLAEGKTVKILASAARAATSCAATTAGSIVETIERHRPAAAELRRRRRRSPSASLQMFAAGEFDVATVVYNRFKSAMTPDRHPPAAHSASPPPEAPAPARPPRTRPARRLRVRAGRGARSWPTCCRATRGPDLPRAAGERAPASRARA